MHRIYEHLGGFFVLFSCSQIHCARIPKCFTTWKNAIPMIPAPHPQILHFQFPPQKKKNILEKYLAGSDRAEPYFTALKEQQVSGSDNISHCKRCLRAEFHPHTYMSNFRRKCRNRSRFLTGCFMFLVFPG